MDERLDFKQLKGVIRRRKKIFIIIFFLVFLLSGARALILPSIYRSEATIVIEEKQIPQDYVKSTTTDYAEKRIHMITRRSLSGTILMEIIKEFNLYPEKRDRYTMKDIVEKMRGDIDLKTISADVIHRRTGRPGKVTIAFTISYEGKNPATVQKITDVLASLYVEEEVRARETTASNTADFFQEELERLKKQIQLHEKEISQFKETHIGELPEQNDMNLLAIERFERKLDEANMEVRSLEDRKAYLKGQIALVDPLKPVVTEQGKVTMNPKERLKGLRLRLISLQSTLSEKHPDVRRLKNEIRELEAQVGKPDDSVAKIKRLSELEGQLADLKGKLGPKHPDVIKLSREVGVLSKEVDKLLTEKATAEVAEEKPDNPAYINLRTQIVSADIKLKSLRQEKKKTQEKIEEYQRKIETAPLVEKEYNILTLDYESARRRYDEIMNKLLEARIAQGMEKTQRGKRFTITEPAYLPEKPYKPNRIAIILIGFVLALGAGAGLAGAQEYADNSVKTVNEVKDLTGVPVFSVIPLMETDKERRVRSVKRMVLILAAVGVIVLVLNWVNPKGMPLDILWTKIQHNKAMSILLPKAKGPAKDLDNRYQDLIKPSKKETIHIVKKGDSLSSIANRFNVPLSDLLIWNNLHPKEYIYPDDRLIIYRKEAEPGR